MAIIPYFLLTNAIRIIKDRLNPHIDLIHKPNLGYLFLAIIRDCNDKLGVSADVSETLSDYILILSIDLINM